MKLSSGLTRLLPIFAVSMGLSATAFAEPQPKVTIPLGGKSFGVTSPWIAPTSKNLIASSLPKTIVRSNWFFWPTTYTYNLTGTVHAEGYLGLFVAPGTPFNTFLDRIKPGSSSILKGQVALAPIDDTLIKNTTISGHLDSVFGGPRIGISLTIGAKINPDGEILLRVSDVKIDSPLAGAIVFDGRRLVDGKTIPGARLVVAVLPSPFDPDIIR